MSDIEDLWNALPTGNPPTARILQQARRNARGRLGRGPWLVAGALTAVGATILAVGLPPSPPDGGAGAPSLGRVVLSPVAFHADLAPVPCDALLATYVDRALGLVTAWGWDSPAYYYRGRDGVAAVVPLAESLDAAAVRGVSSSATGTNVQETAVDEPDTVKTDGRLLVRLRDDDLLTYDVTGPTATLLSTLRLRGLDGGEILLAGDTVVVIGADGQSARSTLTGLREGTRVQTVSLADPGAPRVTDDVTYEAALASVRQNGGTIHMVLSGGLPELEFVHPGDGVTERSALARNRQAVKDSTLAAWLPGFDPGEGRQDLLECQNVAVPPARVGLDTVAVVSFSPQSPTTPRAFGLAGATTIAYESQDRLYLAATPATRWTCFACSPRVNVGGTSYLFQFDLTGDGAVHVASGEVEGTIRDRWSMDEAGGQLRVLVGPSSETGDFNSIVTFTRRGTQLVEQGRLDHIGPREEVKSVRWQDDLALVVTFRRTDPLYAIDLRDQPRIISRLRVPGYSSYLHPLGPSLLIGLGQGPGEHGWGAQMGLFSVGDLTRVHRLDVTQYGSGSDPVAGEDPRAFTWLPEHRTALTVIRRGRTGWLSIQHVQGNRLHNRMIEVEFGDDVARVRTLGLPDGRVVLVTGEKVRFLAL